MADERSEIDQRPNRLVLWDVDHTLIETRGVGRGLFGAAFESVTGRPMTSMAAMAGRTEPMIVRETLELHGIEPTEELLASFYEALIEGYETNVAELRSRGRVLPGARDALVAVAARNDVVSSVLTGNLQRVAVTKLGAFDLDHLVDLDSGAYGSDDADRAALVHVAAKRASAKYGVDLAPESTTLIGDTPNDVAAGLRAGAHVLGVASGSDSIDDLTTAGAHEVVPDLTNLAAVLQAISPATCSENR
jgi:phosphoglycolate phosphatase